MDRESKTHEHEQRFTCKNERVDHLYLYVKNSHQCDWIQIHLPRKGKTKERLNN